jgi:hypothetical protein
VGITRSRSREYRQFPVGEAEPERFAASSVAWAWAFADS